VDLQLRGRAVLLVGGTRGIGRETARLLGTEGARIALVARDPAALDATAAEIRRPGGEAHVIPADVTQPDEAERAVVAAGEALGPFDALIHAAGRGYRGAFGALDDATWREAFDLNLFAVVRTVRLVAPRMARGGRIVLLGAASARQPQHHQSPSNAAKAALANLTVSLADELAPDLVVNCIAPGRILTQRRRDRAAEEARAAGESLEQRLAHQAAGVPLGRLGEPREVAAVVVFFASPLVSFVTGQSIIVDGGLVRAV
jgi:3-oxoacyl-[acyl-carrier protein] reductase